MSGLLGKRLIIGSMSAINTALPRIRAATATDIEPSGEIPVPFIISTRTNATICKATKKKIVGGSSAKNSSLSLVDSLVMELNWSYRFHGSCSFRFRFVVSVDPCWLSQKTRDAPDGHRGVKNNGRPQGAPDRVRPDAARPTDTHSAELIRN